MLSDIDVYWHRDVIQALLERFRPSCYVEIGVGGDGTIRLAMHFAQLAVGVEPLELPGGWPSNVRIYRMKSEEFIAQHLHELPPVDMAFIDGEHMMPTPLEDFVGLRAHAVDGALILLHDTYIEGHAELEHKTLAGDAWRCVERIKSLYPRDEVLTLPAPPGLTLVRVRK